MQNMNHNITIGSKIKSLRLAKKYTLKQLSEESGLSTGFLSQLERGVSSIAIDSLSKLSEILNVSLSSFFDETAAEKPDRICHSFDLPCTQVSSQVIQFILSNDVDNFDILPRVFQLMPLANAEDDSLEMYCHSGEEFIYVLEGVITVAVADEEYVLYPGDSIQIKSNDPHNWINRTNKIVKILSINSPNPFK
ncbi:MAG: cupin domain-containing protein, partial [Oscillospiraceae bacterium]